MSSTKGHHLRTVLSRCTTRAHSTYFERPEWPSWPSRSPIWQIAVLACNVIDCAASISTVHQTAIGTAGWWAPFPKCVYLCRDKFADMRRCSARRAEIANWMPNYAALMVMTITARQSSPVHTAPLFFVQSSLPFRPMSIYWIISFRLLVISRHDWHPFSNISSSSFNSNTNEHMVCQFGRFLLIKRCTWKAEALHFEWELSSLESHP